MILYHLSRAGLKGTISPHAGRISRAFGPGFHTVPDLRQAEQAAAQSVSGVVHTLPADLSLYQTCHFDALHLRALYVAYHRRGDIELPLSLPHRFQEIDSCDIVAGSMADDRMHALLPDFLDGTITDRCLIACMQVVPTGLQVVLKSDVSCRGISILEETAMDQYDGNSLLNSRKQFLLSVRDAVASLRRKYAREGKLIWEIARG